MIFGRKTDFCIGKTVVGSVVYIIWFGVYKKEGSNINILGKFRIILWAEVKNTDRVRRCDSPDGLYRFHIHK